MDKKKGQNLCYSNNFEIPRIIFYLFEKTVTMLKNILAYIILWILFQSFAEINCQMVPFKPTGRYYHTATLINDKLYILGGAAVTVSFNDEDLALEEFFYLNVSATFNTQNLPWQDLSSVNTTVPSRFGAASVNGGANNNTLFLYGGTNDTAALVYTFDPQSNSWSAPTITGASVTRKKYLTGIINDNRKMYLWGGSNTSNAFQNDMLILDTINLSWREGGLVGAPTPRYIYGATLLPNQKIIYMGE